MRIIAGEFRHRLIRGPEGNNTRPMTDRVRTSLFDRLTAMGLMEGGNAIDLFAGTGSAGIEALSRGIDHVTFIERDISARKLLAENLKDFDLQQRSTVLAVNALSPAWLNLLPHRPVNLIFCDPPYAMSEKDDSRQPLAQLLDQLAAVTSEQGMMILRTSRNAKPFNLKNWPEPEMREFGSMNLYYYSPSSNNNSESHKE